MNDTVRQKLIELTEILIARGQQLGCDDREYIELLAGLRCTCLTYNGSVLASSSECPIHGHTLECQNE